MGPNFNFYKFKGLNEFYKTQLRAQHNGCAKVDKLLETHFGEHIRRQSHPPVLGPFGIPMSESEHDNNSDYKRTRYFGSELSPYNRQPGTQLQN